MTYYLNLKDYNDNGMSRIAIKKRANKNCKVCMGKGYYIKIIDSERKYLRCHCTRKQMPR